MPRMVSSKQMYPDGRTDSAMMAPLLLMADHHPLQDKGCKDDLEVQLFPAYAISLACFGTTPVTQNINRLEFKKREAAFLNGVFFLFFSVINKFLWISKVDQCSFCFMPCVAKNVWKFDMKFWNFNILIALSFLHVLIWLLFNFKFWSMFWTLSNPWIHFESWIHFVIYFSSIKTSRKIWQVN